MKISGLQKLTLLDYPGKTAVTVFTFGCNFRCPFCHNSGLIEKDSSESISEDEVLAFLKKRQGILDGVCISGGEPTMQKDLKDFIAKIKQLGYSVKLDTNGSSPELLNQLIEEKLIDYVAMDIKNCKEKYSLTAEADVDLTKISESVEILKQNKIPYEFRTTVVKPIHEADDFEKIGQWLEGESNYFLQQFEDSESVLFSGLSAFSQEEMTSIKNILTRYMPNVKIRGI